MHMMSIEVMANLVVVNELMDPAVIELAKIEVEDSSHIILKWEKSLHCLKLLNQNLNAIRM